MPELESLMGELPAALQDGSAAMGTPATGDRTPLPVNDNDDDGAGDDDELEDDAADNDTDTDTDGDSEEEDGDTDGDAGGVTDEDDDNDDYIVGLGDDDSDDEPKPPAATQPTNKPDNVPNAGLSDEGQFILNGLPKISVNVVVPTADGKGQETKQFQVYGWGDLPRNMLGFVSPYEQGVFTASAQNNELKARELQQQFQTNKRQADIEAYNVRENKAVARDLRALRQEGIFPKFKGVPGSDDFDNSPGAKMFDEVVAYMNEQNDQFGKAAEKGDAFYHMSFRQAYQILHPEAFDKTKQQKEREAGKQVARRVKSGGGTTGGQRRNVQTKRVTNITDLASEFEAFVGSSK